MIGFSSRLFLYNLGSMIVIFLIYPLLVIFNSITQKLVCCKICKNFKKKANVFLFWSKPIMTMMESYNMLALCTLINSTDINFNGPRFEVLSSIFTILFLFLITIFPTFIATLLLRKFSDLGNKEVKETFGDLYEHLRYDTGGRWVVLEPLMFLLRRLVLVVTTIFVRCLAL